MSAGLHPLRTHHRSRLAGVGKMLARIAWSTLSVVFFLLGFMASAMITNRLSGVPGLRGTNSLWAALIGSLVGGAVAGFGGALSSGRTIPRRDLLGYWFVAFGTLLVFNADVWSYPTVLIFPLGFVIGYFLRRAMGRGGSRQGEWRPRSVREMRLDALRGTDTRDDQREDQGTGIPS